LIICTDINYAFKKQYHITENQNRLVYNVNRQINAILCVVPWF